MFHNKILKLFIIFIMLFSFSGCSLFSGGNDNGDNPVTTNPLGSLIDIINGLNKAITTIDWAGWQTAWNKYKDNPDNKDNFSRVIDLMRDIQPNLDQASGIFKPEAIDQFEKDGKFPADVEEVLGNLNGSVQSMLSSVVNSDTGSTITAEELANARALITKKDEEIKTLSNKLAVANNTIQTMLAGTSGSGTGSTTNGGNGSGDDGMSFQKKAQAAAEAMLTAKQFFEDPSLPTTVDALAKTPKSDTGLWNMYDDITNWEYLIGVNRIAAISAINSANSILGGQWPGNMPFDANRTVYTTKELSAIADAFAKTLKTKLGDNSSR